MSTTQNNDVADVAFQIGAEAMAPPGFVLPARRPVPDPDCTFCKGDGVVLRSEWATCHACSRGRFPEQLIDRVADRMSEINSAPYTGPYAERGDWADYMRELAYAALSVADDWARGKR